MTKYIALTLPIFCAFSLARAQESSGPSPSSSPSVAQPSTTSPTTSGRSVRISFVPPPLEGTISLGIYDGDDRLVRVLHQEAEFDEFTIGADALSTKWDGKDDDGYDLPVGKYSAHGFLVAPMKITETDAGDAVMTNCNPVRIKLVANPLDQNDRPTIDINVGFDDENAYLKTADGLPLMTVAPTGDTKRACALQAANKMLGVLLDNGTKIRAFQIVGASKMMAFDCGEFELR